MTNIPKISLQHRQFPKLVANWSVEFVRVSATLLIEPTSLHSGYLFSKISMHLSITSGWYWLHSISPRSRTLFLYEVTPSNWRFPVGIECNSWSLFNDSSRCGVTKYAHIVQRQSITWKPASRLLEWFSSYFRLVEWKDVSGVSNFDQFRTESVHFEKNGSTRSSSSVCVGYYDGHNW